MTSKHSNKHNDDGTETSTSGTPRDLVSRVEEKRGKISARKEEQREKAKKRLTEIKAVGYLNKHVSMVQGWHRRWFILADGEFKYARSQKSKNYIVIPLQNAVFINQRGRGFVVDSGTLVAHLRAKTPDEKDKWIKALAETKQLLGTLAKLEDKSEKHDDTISMASIANIVVEDPLAKMKDYMARIRKVKENLAGHLGPNFDGILEGGKSAKKDVLKDASSHVQELFSTISNLEEEVDIVTTSLMEQIEALKDQTKVDSGEKPSIFETSEEQNDDEEVEDDVEDEDTFESEEFFDAEEHWESFEDEEDSPPIQPKSSTHKKSKGESHGHTHGHGRGGHHPAGKHGSGDSTSEDDESDKEFFKDLSPEVVKSQSTKPKKERKGGRKPTSVVQALIRAQMPSKLSLISNLEASFNTVPSSFKPRDRLPKNKDFTTKISLAKILKDAVGRDMTRMTIPVVFSEPLSLLQRLAEEHEYGDLLNVASTKNDPCLRLAYVASFAVSSYSSTPGRLTKPFNPLLGETFEFIHKKKGFRLVAEQVSHHPPVSAAFAEGREWNMWGHAYVTLKFWGKSMEIFPDGFITAEIPKFKDQYVWNKVTTVVNNVIVGTKSIDHYGEMLVINKSTGDKCKINFEKTGWFYSPTGKVEGIVYNSKNSPKFKLEGSWQTSLKCTPYNEEGDDVDMSKQFVIWEKDPMPEWASQQFNYTFMAMQCNELADYLRPVLPCTDSRWRPDQRAFENGDIDLAQNEKQRLEECQRERRKKNPEHTVQPRWFNKVSKEEGVYSYKGGYWEQRLAGKFSDLPNIFEYELDRGPANAGSSGGGGSGGGIALSTSAGSLPSASSTQNLHMSQPTVPSHSPSSSASSSISVSQDNLLQVSSPRDKPKRRTINITTSNPDPSSPSSTASAPPSITTSTGKRSSVVNDDDELDRISVRRQPSAQSSVGNEKDDKKRRIRKSAVLDESSKSTDNNQ